MKHYDVAIIGAGIAGASIASEIGGDRSVLVLETEDQPGYHATGRSAAFWTETYGGPLIQPLTTASRQFLEYPDAEFSEHSFLTARGAINIGRHDEGALAEAFIENFAESGVAMERWSAEEVGKAIPGLKPEWQHAVFEPDCCDIDVGGLHMAYLRNAKRKGVTLRCNAKVKAMSLEGGLWHLQAGKEQFIAATVVNAAGAWADDVAALAGVQPIGITPKRRTMVQLKTDPPSPPDGRLIVALDGSFYFKPESGGSYWLSPHDEIPSAATDAAPEEMDIAVAIDRFRQVLNVDIISVTRKWAGLRSFAPDRLPVYGFDPDNPNFFWFAGQGGFGIQTAPAAARLARGILLAEPADDMVKHIDGSRYSPARFSHTDGIS